MNRNMRRFWHHSKRTRSSYTAQEIAGGRWRAGGFSVEDRHEIYRGQLGKGVAKQGFDGENSFGGVYYTPAASTYNGHIRYNWSNQEAGEAGHGVSV